MAIALPGKCVALLGLVVLLYATCYGFRLRDIVPQTPSTICLSVHGRNCPDKTVTTIATPGIPTTYSSRKWQEDAMSRTAVSRKPPAAEPSISKTSKIKSVEIDDDEAEEEAVVEVEETAERDEKKLSDVEILNEGIDNSRWKSNVRVKTVKSQMDYDDDDDGEIKQRKVMEPLKKKSGLYMKQEQDSMEKKEDTNKDKEERVSVVTKKLEKVRLADKNKARTDAILTEKFVMEKRKKEEKKVVEVATLAVEKAEETTEDTKKVESMERIKKTVQKPLESAKRLPESAKKIDSVKITAKFESTVPKAATKIDEKSKKREKAEIVISPAINEKEKARQSVDIKKVTKSMQKPPKEVSRKEKREAKSKSKKRTDVSITMSELNDAILHVPTFVPNFTNVEDSDCQQHGKIFLRQLRGYKLWALQMLDSSAKIPSGLLRGNINQLGDFDQCLGVLAHVKIDDTAIRIQGKYCLANVDLHASHPDMKLPVNLMQARAFIRGNMHDPGHFIPRFTTVNWALCLPATCSAKDAERALEGALSDYNVTVGITFTVNVDSNMCYVKQKSQSYSKETIGVLYFYAMVVCLVIVATVRDYYVGSQRKGNYSERVIMSFSLRRTIKALSKEATDAADITCIYGIKALATIALYVAHQLITISRIPLINRTSLTEAANSPLSSILRVSLVYTDTFLLLSGFLTAYNMTRELKTRGEIRWFCRFIVRFIRLTPALFAVVSWYAFVMEHVGSGPQWNSVIARNAELCKHNAWTNLLYVQNFFPFEEMCATHTHQLALDMQLSLLAPILVFFLQYKPVIGILFMAFLVLLSATLRYIATMNNYLSLVIFHGVSIKRLYKTANLTYALPLHRITPYISGVGLGVLLDYTGKNVKIHKVLVILGWLIATAFGSWSLFSPWRLARRDYIYDAEEATHYAVIGPVLWAIALCWSIFACFTEHGGVLNKFLSNYWLVVFSRMSYAVYLSQFAVFFYNIGTTRFSTGFYLHRAMDPVEASVVLAVSFSLTLLFDLPMQEVKSVIMDSTDGLALDASEQTQTSVEKKNRMDDEDASFIDGKMPDSEEISSRDRLKRDYAEQDNKNTIRRRYALHDSEEKAVEFTKNYREQENVAHRNKRSLSKSKDNKRIPSGGSESEEDREESERAVRRYKGSDLKDRTLPKETDDWEFVVKESPSVNDRYELTSRQSKSPFVREATDAKRIFSSKSDEESSIQRRSKPERFSSVETKTSDEEEWERDLRIRRKQFMEKLIAQQRESLNDEEGDALKRRSSAEGRIALLSDDFLGEENMDAWTVSVGRRIVLLGSSQEPSEPDEDGIYMLRREYREQGPPSREGSVSEEESSQNTSRRQSYTSGSQKTSLEDEDDVNNHNFILTKESKRESLQDLSKLSQEELADSGWNVVRKEGVEVSPKSPSSGLFKRESIVKSQASEEDPEYVLPERPKLIQQEREHPFKKAWQMQKSRSEEDGSSAYAIKDLKDSQQSETKSKEGDLPIKREASGEQTMGGEPIADEEFETTIMIQSRSIDTEDNTIDAKSATDETDSVSMEYSKNSISEESHRQSSRSETDEDSAKLSWSSEQDEDEIHQIGQRRKSEEADWNWEQEET